jgi:hypothetical protein
VLCADAGAVNPPVVSSTASAAARSVLGVLPVLRLVFMLGP